MPKINKQTAEHQDHGIVDDYHQDVDGYTVNFVTFRQDMDHAPVLRGLPGDSCQCPHWGYVLSGSMTFRSGAAEETFEAGDAFYVGPGHVPVAEAGTEILQFSPKEPLAETTAAIMRNMQAMQTGG